MEQQFRLQWMIESKDKGKTIKEFLKEHQISKASLTDIKFKGGAILVNGREENVRYILKLGDQLTIYFPVEMISEKMKGEPIPLEILYEDDYLLVVNKPPFMNTIPSREHPYGSLSNALIHYYKKKGILATSHIVTRLDRNTSGIVLIAKHRHIHHLLSLEQRENRIRRTYEAFVHGIVEPIEGVIEAPIARKRDSIIERCVDKDGQYACTTYKVIKQFASFAHVKLRLKTGRTHQIRVHMSYIGHPLLGDELYGGLLEKINRQALHCRSIEFIHPISKETLFFSSALPQDMELVLLNEK